MYFLFFKKVWSSVFYAVTQYSALLHTYVAGNMDGLRENVAATQLYRVVNILLHFVCSCFLWVDHQWLLVRLYVRLYSFVWPIIDGAASLELI